MRLALPRHELRLGLSDDRLLVHRCARHCVPAPLSRLSGSVSCGPCVFKKHDTMLYKGVQSTIPGRGYCFPRSRRLPKIPGYV